MIEERLLNAVLHLFALQAAGLSGAERDAARRRVLAYLHDSVGLVNADTYIGLFDELGEVHADASEAEILEQAAGIADRLRTLLFGDERHIALLRFLELAADAPEAVRPAWKY